MMMLSRTILCCLACILWGGSTGAEKLAAQSVSSDNNTIEILNSTAEYTRLCQWPDGNITFKPQSPYISFSGFVDHPALMTENVAKCYLYTGNSEYLETMRLTIDFLRRMEPMHGQYYGGIVNQEQCGGMDAHGCWAQSFVIPVVWYYMLTGDSTVIDENYEVIADAYDRYLDQQPFMNNCYNHERIFYWKGLIFAKIVMDMKDDQARSARYLETIKLWRNSFNYGWLEPHGYFSQWPYIEYDSGAKRLKLNAYLMPFYANDQFTVDTYWAYWEYLYTTTSSLYFDGWLIDQTLHARQLKALRSISNNLPLLDQWWSTPTYAKQNEGGKWTVWFLLRFLNEGFLFERGKQLYGDYFNYRGWPPLAENGYEVSDLLPMADYTHYDTYILPGTFRYPVNDDTHQGDVLLMGEVFTAGGATEAIPGAFYDAGITYQDVLFYSQRNPTRAMEIFARMDLSQYRVIFIANRHAGAELVPYGPKLLDWVEEGGCLILLNTGTDDAGYPWLPESMRMGQTAGYGAISDPVVSASYSDSPLLNEPNVLTTQVLQGWGVCAGSSFSNVGQGWETVIWRAINKAPLLIQRTHGNGWICATTMDAASGVTHPELIANLYAYARTKSGQWAGDCTAIERAFEYPTGLPVMAHIENFAFADKEGNEMDYPFASSRTEPFDQPFTMSFDVKAPQNNTPATVLIPLPAQTSAIVLVEGQPVTCVKQRMGDQDFLVLSLSVTSQHVEVSYSAKGLEECRVVETWSDGY